MAGKSTTTVTTKGGRGKSKTVVTRTTQQQQGGKGRRQKSGSKRSMASSGSYNALTGHYQMLTDPCNAALTESAYRGQCGIPSRFTRTWTVTTAGSTGYYYQFNPASCGAAAVAVATSASVFTPVETVSGPGFTFLTTNANSWRAVGYCLDIDYIGTELNRSGKWYTGCSSAGAIPFGVATSLNQLKVLFTNTTRTPDRQLESKWFPGVENEEYANRNVTTVSYSNGRNVVAFIAENMPDGVQLTFKETLIVEWLPLPDLGFVSPTAVGGTNPPSAYEALHTAAKRDPSFVHSFTEGMGKRLSQYAHSAGTGFVDLGAMALRKGGMRLARSAMRAAPLLLGA